MADRDGTTRDLPPALAWTAGDDPRSLSLWFDDVGSAGAGPLTPRPSLDGDTRADVVIVGAGLTGLWTAYYLLEADPALDVVVVEQEIAGFGASGRNAGWCSARFPVPAPDLARRYGDDAARSMRAAMRDTVVEVGGVAAAEQIDCDFAYGGSVTVARSAPQLARLTAASLAAHRWGDELHLLDRAGVAEHVAVSDAVGGTWNPDCARVQPVRLVQGLADAVTARGVRIYERTRAVRLSPRAVVTEHGTVRARSVVRATEAWTAQLPGSRRELVPVYSSMIATEPLPAAFWDEVGLRRGETFADARHVVLQCQRTADDRLVVGGRRAAYHPGSPVRHELDQDHRSARRLHAAMVGLFPAAARARVTHAWGGALAVPSDGHASVGLDPETGTAWAGGYGADGVATANLAGRTLADLLTGTETALTRLPWVDHRSPRWAPEPARWARVAAGLGGRALADLAERVTSRPVRPAASRR